MTRQEEQTADAMARSMATALWIDYTNHEGSRSWRHIRPLSLSFGTSPYHPNQWVMVAVDLSKEMTRAFVLTSIHRMSFEFPGKAMSKEPEITVLSSYADWLRESDRGEEYLIKAIKTSLLSPYHKQKLSDLDLDLSDVLNGRIGDYEGWVQEIFADWNRKLGFYFFGFDVGSKLGTPYKGN